MYRTKIVLLSSDNVPFKFLPKQKLCSVLVRRDFFCIYLNALQRLLIRIAFLVVSFVCHLIYT